MSEIWDDRRKALEEDYFRRKERETIEKMREHMFVEAEAEAALKCPRDHELLTRMEHEGIYLDRCPQCKGVWFDAGEMETLTNREQETWVDRFIKSFKD